MKLNLTVLGFALLLSACQQDKPAADADTAAAPVSRPLPGQKTPDGTAYTMSTDEVFGPTDALIKDQASASLQQLVEIVRGSGSRQLLIRVYSDANGDDNQNLILSQRRAQAIDDWLRAHEVSTPAELQGLGEADPVAPNANADGSDNPAGRAQNRRLVVLVQ